MIVLELLTRKGTPLTHTLIKRLTMHSLKSLRIMQSCRKLWEATKNPLFTTFSEQRFLCNDKCKGLFSSQVFVIKAIFILSNMADNVPEASDDSNVGSLDHVNLVQSCLNTITYLNHVSVEFSRKRKSNL